jgi:hypothetical protein
MLHGERHCVETVALSKCGSKLQKPAPHVDHKDPK